MALIHSKFATDKNWIYEKLFIINKYKFMGLHLTIGVKHFRYSYFRYSYLRIRGKNMKLQKIAGLSETSQNMSGNLSCFYGVVKHRVDVQALWNWDEKA